MATALPLPGIYFRKGHFDDRLIDDLITIRVSVALITPLGVEEKEMEFTGSDILSAVNAMLAVIANLGTLTALPVARTLGGELPSAATQRAMARAVAVETEPA